MPIDYAKGKIYTIVNSANTTVYVGSTVQHYLSCRLTTHRRDALTGTSPFNMAMKQLGGNNFQIILHHAFPCQSKDELEAEEYKTMNAIIAAGTPVYNDKLNGRHSLAARAKMGASRKGMAAGTSNGRFNYGVVHFEDHPKYPRWCFSTQTGHDKVKKTFSCSKFGHWQAKELAEAERKKIYPEWEKDPEDEELEMIMRLGL